MVDFILFTFFAGSCFGSFWLGSKYRTFPGLVKAARDYVASLLA